MCFEGQHPEREAAPRLDRLARWAEKIEEAAKFAHMLRDTTFMIGHRIAERRVMISNHARGPFQMSIDYFHRDGLQWSGKCGELRYGLFMSGEALSAFFGVSREELVSFFSPGVEFELWAKDVARNIRKYVAQNAPPPQLPAAPVPFGLLPELVWRTTDRRMPV